MSNPEPITAPVGDVEREREVRRILRRLTDQCGATVSAEYVRAYEKEALNALAALRPAHTEARERDAAVHVCEEIRRILGTRGDLPFRDLPGCVDALRVACDGWYRLYGNTPAANTEPRAIQVPSEELLEAARDVVDLCEALPWGAAFPPERRADAARIVCRLADAIGLPIATPIAPRAAGVQVPSRPWPGANGSTHFECWVTGRHDSIVRALTGEVAAPLDTPNCKCWPILPRGQHFVTCPNGAAPPPEGEEVRR